MGLCAVKDQQITGVEFDFYDMFLQIFNIRFEMIPVIRLAEFPALIVTVKSWNTLKPSHVKIILIR